MAGGDTSITRLFSKSRNDAGQFSPVGCARGTVSENDRLFSAGVAQPCGKVSSAPCRGLSLIVSLLVGRAEPV